jgi:phosphatidylglycerophosphatase A
VWDEICGYLITMIGAPSGWQWILIGFLLFRIFDIWKPWPIRLIDQKVHGGFGIMLDDLLAGVYAGICLLIVYNFV